MSKPAAAGGTTFTINPSAQSGNIQSADGIEANAQAGSNLTAGVGSTPYVGQFFFGGDTYSPAQYIVQESFFDFSLAAVTGTVASAVLSLGLGGDQSVTDFIIEARLHDWGATLTTADWVAGASLGGKTLLASLSTSGIGATNAYKVITENGTALKDAVVAAGAGTLRMVICSSRHRLGSAIGGDEYVYFAAYSDFTLKPKLVVTTT